MEAFSVTQNGAQIYPYFSFLTIFTMMKKKTLKIPLALHLQIVSTLKGQTDIHEFQKAYSLLAI